ncbi:MAG: histidine--tRNA ligase [Thermoplasmata archaeon]
MNIAPLRGFREFYPEQMKARREVFDKLLSVVRAFGFRETDAPSLESLDIFKLKSGEGIVAETFSFVDKGGREVTLIPELTPAVARMVSQQKNLVKPIKWYSFPKLWRYEEPQSGRLREFYQLNIDILGVPGVIADAECIAVAVRMLQALGLRDEFVIRISDRRLLQGILTYFGVKNIEEAYRAIDKKDKIPHEDFLKMLKSSGLDNEKLEKVVDILAIKGPFVSKVAELSKIIPASETLVSVIDWLKELASYLERYGVEKSCILDLSIVRGIAYYTGTVFECYDTKGELRAMFGGGRYDNLVELFGGEPTPAVGFAMGDAVLELLLRRANLWPEEKLYTDYFVAYTDKKFLDLAIKITNELRKKGYITEYDLLARSFAKQMKYANRLGSKIAIILGEDEVSKGKVVKRDMDSGKQELVDISEFVS